MTTDVSETTPEFHRKSEWQPIETAPKGKDVLLYNPPVFREGHPRQQTHGACIRVGSRYDWPNRMPTHWMPLPEPPHAS